MSEKEPVKFGFITHYLSEEMNDDECARFAATVVNRELEFMKSEFIAGRTLNKWWGMPILIIPWDDQGKYKVVLDEVAEVVK